MPTIARFGNLKVQVFADDHNSPHFHVVGPDSEALIEIGTMRLMRGVLRRRDLDAALSWAANNIELLERAWNELNG